MKLHSDINVNGKLFEKGKDIPRYFIYPFFGIHMLMFGISGFMISYEAGDLAFAYMHGGIAITVYIAFYIAIFGIDEVKWLLINSALGIFGIYSQLTWIMGVFSKDIGSLPWYYHITPFIYYVLYTFLLRNALIDLTGSRDKPGRLNTVNIVYTIGSLAIYGSIYLIK